MCIASPICRAEALGLRPRGNSPEGTGKKPRVAAKAAQERAPLGIATRR